MYGVSSSKDARSGIQNGFWGIKVFIYVGAIVGAFFIPSGTFTEGIGIKYSALLDSGIMLI